MIVIELLKNGDLLSYMEKFFEVGKMPPPSPLRLLSFCRQVASGMDYLSNKAFVHRDLAASNILLNELHQCKIGDFGMARDLENSEYYIMSRRGPMPLKWTAPEALNYRKYSTFSDCYSYGMVLYEIWSVGREPLPGISIKEVPDLVTNGFCQAPPPGCPRAIYELMVKLWNPKKRQRPPFSAIVQYLQQPDEQLLAWSEEDQIVSSQVTVLGAPLEEGKNLYPGLQNAYQSTWC
jgi:serine/threonine protein kinase